jgi:hypothetical protein
MMMLAMVMMTTMIVRCNRDSAAPSSSALLLAACLHRLVKISMFQFSTHGRLVPSFHFCCSIYHSLDFPSARFYPSSDLPKRGHSNVFRLREHNLFFSLFDTLSVFILNTPFSLVILTQALYS